MKFQQFFKLTPEVCGKARKHTFGGIWGMILGALKMEQWCLFPGFITNNNIVDLFIS